MDSPLQITLRDIPRSQALEERIREQATKLERFFADIGNCRVSIHRERSSGHKEGVVNVRVDLQVPGETIVTLGASADAQAAVREAFGRAAHQLQVHAQRLRGQVGSQRHVA